MSSDAPTNSGETTIDDATPANSVRWVVAVELFVIVVLFFVAAGQRAPLVNESHYLARSVHFWNPSWCSGDLFLESQEAHPVFHWTIGWMSQFLSLPAYAWVSRAGGWVALAAGWMFLSRRMFGAERSGQPPWIGWHLFSVSMAVMLWDKADLAGEWVVGGCEAKTLAYVFVLFGLGNLVNGNYRYALPLFGLGAAFHPLVGGWALVAAFIAWLCDNDRPTMGSLVLPAAAALCLAAPGVFAALRLDLGADPEDVKQAHRIYVFKRLGHHLLLSKFATLKIVRHSTLIVAWLAMWRFLARQSPEGSSRVVDMRLQRLNRFVLGCVLLAAAGAIIELITHRNPFICSNWMRYYWYRMTDSMVPIGFVFCLVAWISGAGAGDASGTTKARMTGMPTGRRGWAFAVALILVALSAFATFAKHTRDRRAPADMQGRTRNRSRVAQRQDDGDWKAVCEWCRENTPQDSLFLTPMHNQTFKWYAHRAEFATWKDTPQDSQSIVQWYSRRRRLRRMGFDRSRPKPPGNEISEFLREENIEWVIVARHYGDVHWHLELPEQFRLRQQNASYQLIEFLPEPGGTP